jgi:hypothetical protein
MEMTSSTSLLFRIPGPSYLQVTAWQQEIDTAVLRHQIETRGQALVLRRGAHDGVEKICSMPETSDVQPYYGTYGGAYRYAFHPLLEGCELEVSNQMGGYAFYYPERFDPLRMYLFDSPVLDEKIATGGNGHDAEPKQARCTIFREDLRSEAMLFSIPSVLFTTFTDWPWAHRPLHAYDFIFLPGLTNCQVRVRARESGVELDLTPSAAI